MNTIGNYKVLILAAGVGKRLSYSGIKTPKSLLIINKQTIIEKIIKVLKKKKLKDITIAVGYKNFKVIKFVKSLNKKIKFITIDNFDVNGSSFSWYSFEKEWKKNPKPLLILHADIFFDENLLYKILSYRNFNVIGSIIKKNNIIKKKWIVRTNSKKKIIKILNIKSKKKKYYKEIACINKFSIKYTHKIFNYMRKYFKSYGKKFTWEIILNDFIKRHNVSIYSPHIQNYYWFNINDLKDFREAKLFSKQNLN